MAGKEKEATTFGILELISDTLMFPWVHSKFDLVSSWREKQIGLGAKRMSKLVILNWAFS